MEGFCRAGMVVLPVDADQCLVQGGFKPQFYQNKHPRSQGLQIVQ